MLRMEKRAGGGGTFPATWLTFPLSHLNLTKFLTLQQTVHKTSTSDKAPILYSSQANIKKKLLGELFASFCLK